MPDSKSTLYRIEKFKKEHLVTFDIRSELSSEIAFFKDNEHLQELWQFKMSIFTLLYDNKPILIYGMQSLGTGTYFPMVYAGKGIDKHKFAVVRCIYDYVEKFVGKDVRRFEASVDATDKKANRLVRFFGMEPIGIRRQATLDGNDQIIYERLWRK